MLRVKCVKFFPLVSQNVLEQIPAILGSWLTKTRTQVSFTEYQGRHGW